MVTRDLPDRAGLKADEGRGGTVTLIQRFGSAANLHIRLHCLVPNGACRGGGGGVPTFIAVTAPTDDELYTLLQPLIARLTKLRTRRGVLVEDMGHTDLPEPEPDAVANGDAEVRRAGSLLLLQETAVASRITFGPRAGRRC